MAAGSACELAATERWRDFERRAASLRDDGGTLRSIHREFAAVPGESVELRTAKC